MRTSAARSETNRSVSSSPRDLLRANHSPPHPPRAPRTAAAAAAQSTAPEEPRSPLSLRPLFEWEKSLAKHLVDELSLRWSTARDEAVLAAAAASSPDEGATPAAAAAGEGGVWKSGRRGRVRIALDQIGDDGSCRLSGAHTGGGGGDLIRPPRHPEAVPACLLGALLPPVRLSCVPFAFAAGAGAGPGAAKGGLGDEGFPRVSMNEAGRLEVDGRTGGELGRVEGGWAVSGGLLPSRSAVFVGLGVWAGGVGHSWHLLWDLGVRSGRLEPLWGTLLWPRRSVRVWSLCGVSHFGLGVQAGGAGAPVCGPSALLLENTACPSMLSSLPPCLLFCVERPRRPWTASYR